MTTRQRGGGRDDEVFEEIYRKYVRNLIRYFMRVFRVSEEDAGDLTQKTFICFLEHMDEYRGDAVWAYLETVARNVGFNTLRAHGAAKRSKVKPLPLGDAAVQSREQGTTPDYDSRIDNAKRLRALRAEIENLPRGQRQCLLLWLADFDYKEIATTLGISLDAVKSRLRDAKQVLRERLGPDGEFPEEES